MRHFDVLVLGGGASGLMCALHAAQRGLHVAVLEKAQKVGIKILVSGGGRCNFTNVFADPRKHYLSDNPNFCISAMRRYTPNAFISMVEDHGISYHEKQLGQLFCDHSAKQIVAMLVDECLSAGVKIFVNAQVTDVSDTHETRIFSVTSSQGQFCAKNVVLATGGLSMPKVATDLAFNIARKFHAPVVPTRPALVPLLFNDKDRATYSELSGVAVKAIASCANTHFHEDVLFTHRGLSGPGILQISSYWREQQDVHLDLLPDLDTKQWLTNQRAAQPRRLLGAVIKPMLANRLVDLLIEQGLPNEALGNASNATLQKAADQLSKWTVLPITTEGYRTAEVTLGGIDTNALSSKTMEFRDKPGLYAIGEAVDITGWLGGYNFQWAWASGYVCAQALTNTV